MSGDRGEAYRNAAGVDLASAAGSSGARGVTAPPSASSPVAFGSAPAALGARPGPRATGDDAPGRSPVAAGSALGAGPRAVGEDAPGRSPVAAGWAPAAPGVAPAPTEAELQAELAGLRGQRVAVALSGGVDSAVTGLLLKQAGAEVIGLTAHLFDRAEGPQTELEGARRVAAALEIPLEVVDARGRFEQDVIQPFVDAYAAGQTPNPCVRCNHSVKLDLLVRAAEALGCARLATGHYARLRRGAYPALFQGADPKKDQSYFLFAAPTGRMGRLLFPLGARSKVEIKALGAGLGLGLERRPESQEVCFVADGAAGDFVAARSPAGALPGVIEDERGQPLGQHRGVVHYTIGQRRGLGVASNRGPLYVLGIDAAAAKLTVGPAPLLLQREVWLRDFRWLRPGLPEALSVTARIRYRHPGQRATLRRQPGDRAQLCFDEPVRAVAPGQAAVCYLGQEVVGGGWIARPE